MAAKNGINRTSIILPSADGKCWSNYPAGDKPTGGGGGEYFIDFTAASAESPIRQGGLWVNNTQGATGHGVMGTQASMQIRESTTGPMICCETGIATGYADSFGYVPGYSGNQRVEAYIYRAPGYDPNDNHEMEIFLGCVVYGTDNKRNIEILIAKSGGVYVVWFDGPSNSFHVIWSSNILAIPPVDNDKYVAELNRAAKTIKVWRNGTLVCATQWNTTHDEIDAAAQAVLNDLGDGAGLAGLRRDEAGTPDAVEGSFGWRSFRVSSTLLDAG